MLPSGYREVEWIESNGAQYLSLGNVTVYKGTTNFRLKFSPRNNLGDDATLFGIQGVYSVSYWANGSEGFALGGFNSNLPSDKTRVYEISLVNGVYTDYLGNKTVVNQTSDSFAGAFGIFCRNIGSAKSKYALYELELWDDVHGFRYDIKPCYRVSDSVISAYDEANNNFLTNLGTGAFTKGQELLFERRTTYIDVPAKVYGSFPHTLTVADIPQYSVQGHEIRTEWYYDAALTQKANVGDVITETVTLYEKVLNVNKAEYMGEVQIDLTGDTITEADVDQGIIFHKANGFIVEGSRIVNPVAEENDVIFIDYDGTIRYSYSLEDFQALTELPPAPDHSDEGLVFQEWNWTLAGAKSYVSQYGELVVGATYTKQSNEFYVEIPLPQKVKIGFAGDQGVTFTVNWGDGSPEETISCTSYYDETFSSVHQYSRGSYVITVKRGGQRVTLRMRENWLQDENGYVDRVSKFVTKAVLGDIYRFDDGAFGIFSNLQSVVVSPSVTEFGAGNTFDKTGLKSFVFPNINNLAIYTFFLRASNIKYVSFSEKFAYNTMFGLSESKIKKVTLPTSITEFSWDSFQRCFSLLKIAIPASVTSIGNEAFIECKSLKEVKFYPTVPPTLGGSNVFYGVPTDCVFKVPRGSLTAYKTATNYPNPTTYTYEEFDP